jgi:hypothetical protein
MGSWRRHGDAVGDAVGDVEAVVDDNFCCSPPNFDPRRVTDSPWQVDSDRALNRISTPSSWVETAAVHPKRSVVAEAVVLNRCSSQNGISQSI